MSVGGITGVYFDWYRRLFLEYTCEAEEVAEYKLVKLVEMKKNPLFEES
jgi:hypothetical protein